MSKKIRMCAALFALLVLMGVTALVPGVARAEEGVTGTSPVIVLTDAPAYGERRPIQGRLIHEDGSKVDPAAWRLAVFLQLSEGDTLWPKPTYDKPYVEPSPDGSFSATFITGGTDYNAEIIHLMLVPSSYPSEESTFDAAQSVAVDYVRIDRDEEGGVAWTPAREAPDPAGAAPAVDAGLPVHEDRIAVNVGFHIDGSGPGTALSEDLVRRQLDAVSEFADVVRLYAAGGSEAQAYRIAHEMGLKVVGTAYLCGDEAADKAELDALVDRCNEGYAQIACVGNETLLDTGSGPKLTEAQLITDIRYVRERITDASIPVTTSDGVDVLIAKPAVRNVCSAIMVNEYPYWNGTDISKAVESFTASIAALQAVANGKQVLVSETGHPTGGDANGAAIPGEQQAAKYFEGVRAWSLKTRTPVLFFQATDEQWKSLPAYGGEGSVGSHWGFMTSDLELKEGYAQTSFFQSLGIGAGCVHHRVVDKAVPASCTQTGLTKGTHCTVCGRVITPQTKVPALGHDWGAWQVVRKATTGKEGLEQRTCANDVSHVETRPIAKLASSSERTRPRAPIDSRSRSPQQATLPGKPGQRP